ncbi:MAG: nitrite/sulfite reductase [Alphaproteobacteria bacterium]|nr:nitrite/sulfite reductase [Alphaproteobacteria bacterium]
MSEVTVEFPGSGAGNGAGVLAAEPLALLTDIDEFRQGYGKFKSGEWDNSKWQPFRLRYGVYGQLQPGVHMIRIKFPGGIMDVDGARAVAEANRRWAGAKLHLTTRQAIQIYYISPDDAPEVLEYLCERGITTREACGNSLRNMDSCQLAGVCPREHVDAGKVAQRLALSWIRHPLVQHMPRKFKTTVSGCETDCASTHIHDLGLIATRKDGKVGFKVFAGGGTGGIPVSAVEVADFVTEEQLPAVVEALVRLHQRYSNRKNRNKARIKFLVKRFGAEKFRALFQEEFARALELPQRPWEPLEWRQPTEAPEPVSPGGVVAQHDGKACVIVNPPLGLLTSDEFEALADLAERYGADSLRVTRDQNLAITGLDPETVTEIVGVVRGLGFGVEDEPGDVANVVACPGTSTCGIGITNSQNFGKEILDQVQSYTAKPNLTVNVSGCQNGCGLHHVADFGFRGMGKKIGGKNAPHYQIYFGGDARKNGHIGLTGPIVPARLAKTALDLVLDGYATGKVNGETVREWALRLGKDGLKALVKPIEGEIDPENEGLFFDFGEDWTFSPPAGRTAECAAGFEDDDLMRDLADDGLINMDRALAADRNERALVFAREGFRYAAERLRIRVGLPGTDDDSEELVISTIRGADEDDTGVIDALDGYLETRVAAEAGGDPAPYREALALWIDTAAEMMARPVTVEAFDPTAFDKSGGVMDLIRGS